MARNPEAETLGRAAFWGQAPAAWEAIRQARGYFLNGRWHKANGLSLEEAIEGADALIDTLNRKAGVW